MAIHELMRGLLVALPQRPPQPRTIYAFELKLLNELGLRPDLDKGHLSAGAKKLVIQLMEEDWPVIATLSANPNQARELRQFLHGFFIFHLGKIPCGRTSVLT
jgi:recombinational DNA repair protein (RecF pathway)